MQPLPIDAVLADAVAAVRRCGRLVLAAPPGSGKTTRIPAALVDAGLGGEVLVLEPRRLAARAAARRVAEERGGRLGDEVGYQVRHETLASERTRLRFVTEGVLVRRVVADPFLEGVAAVVLDEFHERHVETDLALAMLREVRETVRPELALVVMSATLEAEPIAAFLGAAPILRAEGRRFDVAVRHRGRPGPKDRLEDAVRAAVVDALQETGGDVLVFLPGVEEIRRAARALEATARGQSLDVLPLHGNLAPEEQDRAIARGPRRKVVLATNVAESSVTIDGVSAVVDSGLARVLRSDPARGVDVLRVERISLASAAQRAGRAGRTGPGVCHRLWSAGDERGLPAFDTPELKRADLAGPALLVRAFAGRAPRDFAWFEAPERAALDAADALLTELAAVDDAGRVTAIGRRMLASPVHPRLARALVEGERLGCGEGIAAAVAVLAERDFVRRPAPGEPPVPIELGFRLRLLARLAEREFQAEECRAHGVDRGAIRAVDRARRQLARRLARSGTRGTDQEERIARALLAGFADRVVLRRSATQDEGVLVGGRGVRWPAGAFEDDAELLLALELGERDDAGGARWSMLRLAVSIERAWLADVAPGALRETVDVELDESAGQILVLRRLRYHDLVLDERRVGAEAAPADLAERLAARLRADPWRWIGEQPALKGLCARIAWLRGVRPELGLEVPDDARIAAAAAEALGSRRSLKALAEVDLAPYVALGLGAQQRRELEIAAPERVVLPSGRKARVEYPPNAAPTVAARIQDFFGWLDAPRLGGGRVPLVIQLCAPNQRPVQITADLRSFWANAYPKLRIELKRRYPRHAWPEDPTTAADAGRRPNERRD
ncbi:MAG: ATP-dependent helicase HrpB [Planctomycetes bacterium]|nr:ATP-dependent helicase HrpB [Planctomycetota bacterium]